MLDVALRLEKLLQKELGVEVVLTRRTDVYVPLEERTAIANREGADLFLSIHANASADRAARGIETYFLSFAPNAGEPKRWRRARTRGSAQKMRQLPDIVKAIALNNKIDESRDFAAMVQESLVERAEQGEPGGAEPRRQEGAVRGADRRDDAERARGDLVHHQQAGSGSC